jgi:hypothetical protein
MKQKISRHQGQTNYGQIEPVLEDNLQADNGRLDYQVDEKPEDTEGNQTPLFDNTDGKPQEKNQNQQGKKSGGRVQ